MALPTFTDHYLILGISRESTISEIKDAYHTKALALHPDKNIGDEVASTNSFQILQASYKILEDVDERFHYDRDYDSRKGLDRGFHSSCFEDDAELTRMDNRGRAKKRRQEKMQEKHEKKIKNQEKHEKDMKIQEKRNVASEEKASGDRSSNSNGPRPTTISRRMERALRRNLNYEVKSCPGKPTQWFEEEGDDSVSDTRDQLSQLPLYPKTRYVGPQPNAAKIQEWTTERDAKRAQQAEIEQVKLKKVEKHAREQSLGYYPTVKPNGHGASTLVSTRPQNGNGDGWTVGGYIGKKRVKINNRPNLVHNPNDKDDEGYHKLVPQEDIQNRVHTVSASDIVYCGPNNSVRLVYSARCVDADFEEEDYEYEENYREDYGGYGERYEEISELPPRVLDLSCPLYWTH